MRAHVEPGKSAPHSIHVELAFVEIGAIDIGNFQLSTRGRSDLPSDPRGIAVKKIKPRNRVTRFWFLRLFFNRQRAAGSIELYYPVALGIRDWIGKDDRPILDLCGLLQTVSKIVTVENIVAKNQGALTAVYAIEHTGTQNHYYTLTEFVERYRSNFGKSDEVESLLEGA